MNLRRNVRASFQRRVTLRGIDREGKPFQAAAETVDFSRKGLGLLLDNDLVSPGSVLNIRLGEEFESDATVQWKCASPDGRVRLGVRLLRPQVSLMLRVAAGVLLAIALIGQLSYSKSNRVGRASHPKACGVSVDQMKAAVEGALGPYAAVGASERAFLHIQHQQMGCEEYTRLFEKSDFFSDRRQRDALSRWHWRTYHSSDESVRLAAIRSAEAALGSSQ